jgi:hypothetical protein
VHLAQCGKVPKKKFPKKAKIKFQKSKILDDDFFSKKNYSPIRAAKAPWVPIFFLQ